MNRVPLAVLLLAALCVSPTPSSPAQTLETLNLHAHGYATQSVIYSDHNNWNKTQSTSGSPAWVETVANLTSQPKSRLRIGVQTRYFLLGDYGHKVTLDWASAEFKANEHFGIRAGKVKSPTALFNESQDIDPAYIWILLPQSIYPLASRNGNLAHFGGVLFGNVSLPKSAGKLDYRAFGGQRRIGPDDGYLDSAKSAGFLSINGLRGPTFGGSVRWHPPLPGLLAGAAIDFDRQSGFFKVHNLIATDNVTPTRFFFFSQYERSKWTLAGEYGRVTTKVRVELLGAALPLIREDGRSFYGMASYKLRHNVTGGIYYSNGIDHQIAPGPARYQKDWALAARYDPTAFLYLKFEQHFIDGTAFGFSPSNNPAGLSETSRLTLIKLGVSF